ncbi:hypothetical protein [Hymenobacter cheonanensis]|uniref:hypothetical protein n=1 Tax=Hymenobacter sp. CA2-7 TaxID=3063993 RepID=UPI00271221D0|nr:hypothetical protein [Hymenobacter sp. CA2-7]MDO7885372.1 hypothetical protein [Hymenobacter sp. CA2-7]
MQRTHIHIKTVLAEIELPDGNGQPLAFSLGYYKTNGTKGSKAAVRKGGHSGGSTPGGGAEGRSAFRYKLKEKGTVQLVDCATGRPFALKIILLCHYNGRDIKHG